MPAFRPLFHLVLVQAPAPLSTMQQPLLPPQRLQVAVGWLGQPALSLEGLRADGKPALQTIVQTGVCECFIG